MTKGPSPELAPRRSARRQAVLAGAGPYIGVGTLLIAMVIALVITQAQFATYGNLINVLQTNAVLLVVAVGLTFVMIGGGFDLSVGGMLALSGVILAQLIASGVGVGLAIAIVIVGGALMGGLVNGGLIARIGLSFFVVTIGTLSVFRGVSLLITNGESKGVYTVAFLRTFGRGTVAGVPWLVVIALVVLVAGLLVLRYTGFGRMVYAVGGNAEAARLAGINVPAVLVATYVISGGLAALAGVMETASLATAEPNAVNGIELTAAAAVLLGGTSFAGGTGSVLGTLLGTLFLGVLANGLTISGVSSFWQGVITGGVLIAAMVLDRVRRGRQEPR